MIKAKVARQIEGMCGSCSQAIIVEQIGRVTLICRLLGVMRKPVESCSEYTDKNTPSMYTYRETAWILRADSKTHEMRWMPPKQDDDE